MPMSMIQQRRGYVRMLRERNNCWSNILEQMKAELIIRLSGITPYKNSKRPENLQLLFDNFLSIVNLTEQMF